MPTTRSTARALWTLLALFALRVLGQLLVLLGVAPFLPPMDDWQSGLLPYPLLLASQVLILALCATICMQFSRGRGYFVQPHAASDRHHSGGLSRGAGQLRARGGPASEARVGD
jgi:hypothetical protein